MIIDSRSVRTTEAGGVRGYDAGKKVPGRKRHIIVDTLGNLLEVVVHAANIQDRDGARLLPERLGRETKDAVQLIWADGACGGRLVEWVRGKLGAMLEVVPRWPLQDGVSGAAPAVGGGAWSGIARPLPEDERGLRAAGVHEAGHGLHRRHSNHAQGAGPPSANFQTGSEAESGHAGDSLLCQSRLSARSGQFPGIDVDPVVWELGFGADRVANGDIQIFQELLFSHPIAACQFPDPAGRGLVPARLPVAHRLGGDSDFPGDFALGHTRVLPRFPQAGAQPEQCGDLGVGHYAPPILV